MLRLSAMAAKSAGVHVTSGEYSMSLDGSCAERPGSVGGRPCDLDRRFWDGELMIDDDCFTLVVGLKVCPGLQLDVVQKKKKKAQKCVCVWPARG